ncbi:hypothetical protein MKW98_025168 [Papaver atlanticum]|uniref:Uncharacterized protein n=1 Tax=Papaver atlanticum TaxID=357466 RepID=A0AAD4S225_9MAGN|nr:hypothetical protein MKW98_025168 [Papaver atlanticum]
MAGMDVLSSDKTGSLALNRLTVDRSLIEVPTGILISCFNFRFSTYVKKKNILPRKYMPSLTSLLRGDYGLLVLLIR